MFIGRLHVHPMGSEPTILPPPLILMGGGSGI